ncbi:MAG: tyrosine-protein phosphatase [Deltaproteobacteria bacterium]|nr:tyrosine-protein phosphatase [Deltaproteobacteria bacterium]
MSVSYLAYADILLYGKDRNFDNVLIDTMKIFLKILLGLFLLLAAVVVTQLLDETTEGTSFLAQLVNKHNFTAVSQGRLYRSSEMSNSDLAELIKTQQIKSVIDLRFGRDEPDDNGISEQSTIKSSGAQYFHIPVLGSKIPPKQTILDLLAVYDSAPEPILIHCSSGTHRSGVASALWLIYKANSPPQEAAKQLSPRYGFFYAERWLKSKFQGYPTIDNLLWQYQKDYEKTQIDIKDWVNSNLK